MVPHFYQSETCENIKKSGFQLAGTSHTRSMPDSYPIHTRFIPPTCTASPKPTCVIRKHLLADMFSAKRGFGIFQDYYGNSTPIKAPVCNSSDYRCPMRKPRILGSLGPLEVVGEFVRRPFAYLSKGPRSLSLSLSLPLHPPPM